MSGGVAGRRKWVCVSAAPFSSGFSHYGYKPYKVETLFQPFHHLLSENFTAGQASGGWGGQVPVQSLVRLLVGCGRL